MREPLLPPAPMHLRARREFMAEARSDLGWDPHGSHLAGGGDTALVCPPC